MCGIAGILNLKDNPPISKEHLCRMIEAVRHRGPEGAGIYMDDRIGLGHARLSIIDIPGGAQPIHNEDETLWIVFNGEIFNYVELREDLEKRGHRFYTVSDTEVIIHLFEEKAERCLEELNGQFAFAVWDRPNRRLFLARDRLGIRPLHYTVSKDRLIFASEIKSIFSVEDVERRIDPLALNQIFTFWTTLPGKTAFADVHELQPGHYLYSSNGRIDARRYWNIPFRSPEEQRRGVCAEDAEALFALLKDAVRIRLRADVPVSCYISGGLDSSGIAAIVAGHFNTDLNTFGIRFEEDGFDEGEYQELIAKDLGVRHTQLRAGNDTIAEAFAPALWHIEKPLLRTAPVPLFLLSRKLRESRYKVVLTGEGADEVFGGYNIFREALLRKRWAGLPESERNPDDVRTLYPYIFKDSRLERMMTAFFARGLERADSPFFSHLLRWETTGRIRNFVSDEMRMPSDHDLGLDAFESALPDSFASWDVLTRAQFIETAIFMSNYLLSSQGDRVAMAHSVEIRMPYLDYRVLEFMGRMPPECKIEGDREKILLKEALKSVVPEPLRMRKKQPFRAPISRSLLHPTARRHRDYLTKKALDGSGLFKTQNVLKLIGKLDRNERPGEIDNMALAGVLSAQIVHEQFVSGFSNRSNPAQLHLDHFFDYTKDGSVR